MSNTDAFYKVGSRDALLRSARSGWNRGFTLVELMVTVLILSILVSVALPSYKSSVRKSRRTDAKTALLDIAAREERYFATNNGTYTNVAANLGYSGTWPTPIVVGSGYYQLAQPVVTLGTAGPPAAVATFSVTASPVATSDQAKDLSCASFTITNTGAQTATDSSSNPSTACWN